MPTYQLNDKRFTELQQVKIPEEVHDKVFAGLDRERHNDRRERFFDVKFEDEPVKCIREECKEVEQMTSTQITIDVCRAESNCSPR